MKTIITLLLVIAFSINDKSQSIRSYYHPIGNTIIPNYSPYVVGHIPGYGAKRSAKLFKKFLKSPEMQQILAEQNRTWDLASIRRRDAILDSLTKY